MLDIVIGTESNLIRNSIVIVSSSIGIDVSKIVAKHSKRMLIEQDITDRTCQPIEPAVRSSRPVDQESWPIG
ncbi:hypothetical protein HanHA300_Chr09g0299081 [Helianthus annuus]|nr:hypothetical protein HanHA300_Chr09g0299081 [Helianthus annuus]KAJ0540514.1 hypothetical protein HanHA89_Chr09g0317671 [Helianthus annuus]KAJ0705656.1 hypothetical protein HanLR1_Chr09g0297851 [Helianthus annuus]